MKVSNKMIAKDMRFIGCIYKVILSSAPKKRKKAKAIKYKRHTNTDKTKKSYNEYILRPDGTKLRLQIKRPKNKSEKCPCVLWIHGGGYAMGMPEMQMMSMAKNLVDECIIISPEYRLSVEKPYPAALEDCYQTLLWIKENVEALGGRNDQIFVGGESAGGGLTVATCLYARDTGEVNIACQMPLYPMIDDRMNTDSMKDNNAPVWNEKQNKAAWKLYLDGCDTVSKYAAPAREEDYTNLPPAITFVGSIEPFRDETLTYVNNLKNAGIPVDFKMFDGCFHAFDMMAPWSKQAKKATEFFNQRIRYAYNNYYAPQQHK